MKFAAALLLWVALAVSAAAQAPAANPYEVEGFRSAKFGMTESEVRRAIQIDFNVKESAISREINAKDHTTILSTTVRDLVPDMGPARVIYIIGYARKKLFQVTVLWGDGVSDTPPNDTHVLTTARTLLGYFVQQSFPPEGRVVNAQLADGNTLLFQGIDAKGRVVQLQYGTALPPGAATKGKDAKAERVPFGLLLYSEDPKHPDIFRIKPGQF